MYRKPRERAQQIIFNWMNAHKNTHTRARADTHEKWVQGVYWLAMNVRYVLTIKRTTIKCVLYRFFMFVVLRIIYFVELIASLIYYLFVFFYLILVSVWDFISALHLEVLWMWCGESEKMERANGTNQAYSPTTHNMINNKFVSILFRPKK